VSIKKKNETIEKFLFHFFCQVGFLFSLIISVHTIKSKKLLSFFYMIFRLICTNKKKLTDEINLLLIKTLSCRMHRSIQIRL